jgi:hypothetical protein
MLLIDLLLYPLTIRSEHLLSVVYIEGADITIFSIDVNVFEIGTLVGLISLVFDSRWYICPKSSTDENNSFYLQNFFIYKTHVGEGLAGLPPDFL